MSTFDTCEKTVIGTILADNTFLKELYGYLEPKHFSTKANSDIYKTILEVYSTKGQADLLTVADSLKVSYSNDKLMDILKEYIMSHRVYGSIRNYADIIIKAYNEREYEKIIKYHSSNDINEKITETIKLLENLSKGNNNQHLTRMSDHVKEFKNQAFNPEYKDDFLHLGFQKLDEILGGIDKGDIVVIGARPSVGKSAFVNQIILNGLPSKRKIVYYSLEMSEKQIYQRMISNLTNIALDRVRFGKYLTIPEQKVFDSANKSIEESTLYIRCEGGLTVSKIKHDCKYIDNLDFIVIDYLQLMKADGKYSNRAAEVGDISKSLKALAMELKVPIILLSQLNRLSTTTASKEPTMAELRESGDIEQDASVIMLIWNLDEDNKSKKGIKIDKNRNGSTGKIAFNFYGQFQRFSESNEPVQSVKSKKNDDAPNFDY